MADQQIPTTLKYGLVVKEPWSTLILSGKKTVEIRDKKCHTELVGQFIAVVKSGTNHVFGHCKLTAMEELTAAECWGSEWRAKHCISKQQQTLFNKNQTTFAAYILSEVTTYSEPLKFKPWIGGEVILRRLDSDDTFQR